MSWYITVFSILVTSFVVKESEPFHFIIFICVHCKCLLVSLCLSTCICWLSSHFADFCEVWYWKLLLQSVKKLHICFNQTTIPDILHGDLCVFHIVDSTMCSSTMPRTTILNSALLHHHGGAFSIYIVDWHMYLDSVFFWVLFSPYCWTVFKRIYCCSTCYVVNAGDISMASGYM